MMPRKVVRVLSISSSRADISPLSPIWAEFAEDDYVELHVMLTGSHATREEDRRSAMSILPQKVILHEGGADPGGLDPATSVAAMAEIQVAVSCVIEQIEPDLMIILGDRIDMLPAAIAAIPYRLPVAHLHGGELTYGAIDDRIRHALTKLSDLHFVSSTCAAERLARMGEHPDMITVSGAPALDSLMKVPTMDRDVLLNELDLPVAQDFILLTVHAETDSAEPLKPCRTIIEALRQLNEPLLITAANSDPGGASINAELQAFSKSRPHTVFRETLGLYRYANVMRQASVMVGNSSSGVIEAGLFGLPVVNVGRRQDGRERSRNVQDVACDAGAILAAMRGALERSHYDPDTTTLYGDGNAASRICPTIKAAAQMRMRKRGFFEANRPFSRSWGTCLEDA